MPFDYDCWSAWSAGMRAQERAAEQLQELRRAEPTHYDFGDGCGPVPASRHVNSLFPVTLGGWVAHSAYVDSSCTVACGAAVYGQAQVRFHSAILESGRVYGVAHVHHGAVVRGQAHVCGDAEVHSHATVDGNGICSRGVVCGFTRLTTESPHKAQDDLWTAGMYIEAGCPAIADIYPHLTPEQQALEVDRLRPWQAVTEKGTCLDCFTTEAAAVQSIADYNADGRYGLVRLARV